MEGEEKENTSQNTWKDDGFAELPHNGKKTSSGCYNEKITLSEILTFSLLFLNQVSCCSTG